MRPAAGLGPEPNASAAQPTLEIGRGGDETAGLPFP